MSVLLLLSAILSSFVVGAILLFLSYFSAPLLERDALTNILLGEWNPDASYGLAPMIAGTLYISIPASLLAFVIALSSAMGMDSLAAGVLRRFLEAFFSILTSIPTVVYAFLGVMLVVPMVRRVSDTSGYCILSAVVVLSLLVSPTMILYMRESFRNTPKELRTAVYALGGEEAAYQRRVLLPYNRTGMAVAYMMGLARALGDTMVALMLAGNSSKMPSSPFDGARSLTSHIALLFAGDYDSVEFRSIFASGVILFLSTLLILGISALLKRGLSNG